ncbi:splicing factor YJU2 [Cloeon dipterum]|uniref:splicing factor YJU2 n=1 Tax=Cloeon dipterum TaxID=197152 RepID=UPI00321FA73A
MSERKVLNKYYPPDFDPSKIPRMKLPKNRQYTVRLMAPFNMKCTTCGEYIYKGKKFNARKEDVENSDYLGIRIYRFYIKCTRCLAEISFKTDPKNTDYEIEAGATRNFMALKMAEEQAVREEEERKEEESTNPMKLLENRTKASKREIEQMEDLEELRDLNRRQLAVEYDSMLAQYTEDSATRAAREKAEDEAEIRASFKSSAVRTVTEEVVEDDDAPPAKLAKIAPCKKLASFAPSSSSMVSKLANAVVSKKAGAYSSKIALAVKPKSEAAKPAAPKGLSSLCAYSSASSDSDS